MRNSRTLTVFLLILLTLVVTSSASKLSGRVWQNDNAPVAGAGDNSLRKKISAVKTKQEWDGLLDRLPEADYNAADPADQEQRTKRRVKNSHHDKKGMVVKDSDTAIMLTEVLHEGKERWPMPVGESDAILVGEVQGRQAFLSNDKTGVYTELTVDVIGVLKGDPSQVAPGRKITAERAGGVVRYPNGHRRLYLISGEGLPLSGGRYVLFLKSAGLEDHFSILTMYQLGAETVLPIDDGEQFKAYRGQNKYEFLEALKGELAKTPQSRR